MSDQYMREIVRIAVAQICQTIGYHVIQATPLELLQDTLHKFLHEFSKNLKRQVEHYNRTEANLNDTYLSLNNLNINVYELLDYTNNVQPVALAVEVPKFPVHKNTNLNFLKPGSKEVLTRPVHIYEYLPPMLPTDLSCALPPHYMQPTSSLSHNQDKYRANAIAIGDINRKVSTKPEQYLPGCGTVSNSGKQIGEPKDGVVTSELSPICLKTALSLPNSYDEEGRPTREISSVVMTTGGFISPAIEGKLPDTIVPKFVEKLLGLDAPPPPISPPPPVIEPNVNVENKHHNSSTPKVDVNDTALPFSSPTAKVPTIIAKTLTSECVSNSNLLLAYNSQSTLVNKNTAASDVVNPIASKKPVPNLSTQHNLQAPTIASKLLKKAKKKNTQNLQLPLSGKFNRPAVQNPETSLIAAGIESSDRIQRKSKKILQKMLKTGIDSSTLSPDYCNAVFQRMKMDKFLKKQSKYQKKLLHKQKNSIESSKQDEPVGFSKLEDKIPTPVPSNVQTNSAIPPLAESVSIQPVIQDTASACLLKPDSTQISSVLPQSLTKDNRFDGVCNESVLNNVQTPANLILPHDKKAFPGVKLSAELDKNKLNIFKKISKQKTPKPSSPNVNRMLSAQIYGSNEDQLINLPCGTTITPAPKTLNRLTTVDTSLASSDLLEKSLNLPINYELTGGMDVASNINGNNIPGAMMPSILNTPPAQLIEANKPKKRGRKPGSKNSPKPAVASPNNPSQGAQLKKMKKLKASKYNYPFPLANFETASLIANKMQLCNRTEVFAPNLVLREDAVPTNISPNTKERKERKKGKVKNQPLNMSIGEQSEFKAEPGVPTKEEVKTINKKLMRMDTVLQPLGAFNETIPETDTDVAKPFSGKILPTLKSSTSKKRPALQMPLQHPPNSSLMAGLHPNMFVPPPGLGRIPNLLKLCPFPSGPGLIPPTAQNLLFPRLPPTFHLPIPTFRPQSGEKLVHQEPQNNGKSVDAHLSQPSRERNYCNVPPFVPESMNLSPPEAKADFRKFGKESPRSTKAQQSPDKILKVPDNWGTSDNTFKSLAQVPGDVSLNVSEVQKLNERTSTKSPKASAENPIFMGGIYSINIPPNKFVANSSTVAPIQNNDDPIELSDDSADYPPSIFNISSVQNSKDLSHNKLQLTTPVNFSQIDDLFLPSGSDTARDLSGELDLSSKKSKKISKFAKNTKNLYPHPTTDLPPIDLFSAEKVGVGKLAGGADLIPLISTGSAYSSKTIPPTSLTATVAAPFVLPKKDFPPPNTFENALLPANVDSSGILCMNTELQKKKKEHKRLKKLKDDKAKKKKDKKSKNKERVDHPEKLLHKTDKLFKEKLKETMRCGEEQNLLNKDLLKKLKKEKKKKYKQLLTDATKQGDAIPVIDSPGVCGVDKPANIFSVGSSLQNFTPTTTVASSVTSLVPKLTLRLASGQSPNQLDDIVQKHFPSTTAIQSTIAIQSTTVSQEFAKKREPSPELARISPLVTRPPKQKFSIAETATTSPLNSNQFDSIAPSGTNTNINLDSLAEKSASASKPPINTDVHSIVPPPSPWSSGGTICASSVLLPQQLLQSSRSQEHLAFSSKADGGLLVNTITSTVRSLSSSERQSPVPLISETSRPSSYIDAEGNRVWICPACGKVDDGSPMIGCDGCDAWYHWICVGISVAPKDNEDWFCRVCITRKKGIYATDKKRKRNKKK
ncbi:PREDICTED: transcription initiation factor TFIID subunit 3 [Rhagoletis zephyria]|uniref:transcription initiation factor TFIID subunit 3 n=1 Tax=Rhagoletis zephyria TaxID=28612 RepID=UPI0008117159|nr:PREDICTED: transcription initiation factor TFIID subunit 3 [Rhagoletis zephyria]XP_036334998.1 transcription initiation factor TFIID subunit 3 [Rhagoletis pomonella]